MIETTAQRTSRERAERGGAADHAYIAIDGPEHYGDLYLIWNRLQRIEVIAPDGSRVSLAVATLDAHPHDQEPVSKEALDWAAANMSRESEGGGEEEAPETFAELRDRFVDPEKEKLRAELQRFREACPHRDTTLNGDGTMTCDLCGHTEADPFAAAQPHDQEAPQAEQCRCESTFYPYTWNENGRCPGCGALVAPLAREVSSGDGLDRAELRTQNVARAERWHGPDSAPWSLADWSNAMCGEAGETANIVKKIRRHETSIPDANLYNTPALETLQRELAAEIADTLIYADLLAHYAGIDLSKAVRQKFNEVSFKQDFPEKLAWSPQSSTLTDEERERVKHLLAYRTEPYSMAEVDAALAAVASGASDAALLRTLAGKDRR